MCTVVAASSPALMKNLGALVANKRAQDLEKKGIKYEEKEAQGKMFQHFKSGPAFAKFYSTIDIVGI